MIDRIQWHGHASFSVNDTPKIMIDPWSVATPQEAPDIILVSHEHYDHCSPADVNKLRKPSTLVIASRSAADLLDGEVKVLRPWQVMNFGRLSIKAVPAYTFNSDHPAEREDLGFVISSNYTDIYYAGDTDFVPELRNLRCDIAILPAFPQGGIMNHQMAAAFAESSRPRYVLPSHLPPQLSSPDRLQLKAFERSVRPFAEVVMPEQHHFAINT